MTDVTKKNIDYVKIAGFAIAAASAVTSTLGARALLNASMGSNGVMSNLLGTTLAAAFCFVIQGLIVTFILRLSTQDAPKKKRRAMIALLILTWSLSIGTSYGSYWNLLAKNNFEKRITAESIERTESPIRETIVAFNNAASSFNYVAKHAETMAIYENDTGLSCGYSAGVGKGPRWKLRNDQNTAAKSQASKLTSINDRLQETIKGLNSYNEEAMRGAFLKARSLLSDPAVQEVKSWIHKQETGFKEGFVSGSGSNFDCSDQEMMTLLKSARMAFVNLPDLPAKPPSPISITYDEAMLKSYLRLMGPIASVFGHKPVGAQRAVGEDYAPLMLPLILEMIMSLLLWVGTPDIVRSPRGPWGRNEVPEFAKDKDKGFGDAEVLWSSSDFNLTSFEMLRKYVVELSQLKKTVLAVPVMDGIDRNNALKVQALILTALPRRDQASFMNPYCRDYSFTKLPATFKKQCKWDKKYASDLFEVSDRVFSELKRSALLYASQDFYSASSQSDNTNEETVH